jgi:mono/diheme cytochrome c family protein
MVITRNIKALLFIPLLFVPALSVFASESPDAQQLFEKKCSLCHSMDKRKLGPAVNTMSHEAETLRQAITKGRNSMPGYKGKLTRVEIDALVDYLLSNQQ